ncbi:hypothetical protein PHSC3_001724 [Chlamydiales bacterium STE3]|nr:hypothetical protein PHSC3_001724 [Chlamydiales bacterium STE3]
MVILNCKPHSVKQLYYLVKEEEEWCIVHQSIVPSKAIKWPLVFETPKELVKYWSLEEFKGAKNFALRKIARRAYSSFELEKLLKRNYVSDHAVTLVIKEFAEKQLLDDREWIERFISGEIRKKASPLAISIKLKMKGIPGYIIEESLKKHYTHQMKQKTLASIIAKESAKQPIDKKRLVAKLVRKGFKFEDLQMCLRDFQ